VITPTAYLYAHLSLNRTHRLILAPWGSGWKAELHKGPPLGLPALLGAGPTQKAAQAHLVRLLKKEAK